MSKPDLTFALGDNRHASIWARYIGQGRFEVINGGWTGVTNEDGTFSIDGRKDERHPFNKVWEGEVPHEFADTYNEALPWIERQLAKAAQ